MKTYDFNTSILRFEEGGVRKYLFFDNISKIKITTPTLPEQTRIANFFTVLDKKINQLQEKKALLEEYKKGVMQKIFSQEIRFKDDDGEEFPEWEKKKILDLCENGFSNGVFNDPNKVGKGYRIINVKDMYVGDSIDKNNLTLVDVDKKEFKKNKVEYGDIFFTRSSLVKEGIAHSNINLSKDDDITFDGHLIRMRPKKQISNPIYLSYIFTATFVRKQFIRRGKTTTMTTIGQEDIASVKVPIPSLHEQTKITDFLSKIDSKINTVNEQIEQTKEYKKGLLQKMFCV